MIASLLKISFNIYKKYNENIIEHSIEKSISKIEYFIFSTNNNKKNKKKSNCIFMKFEIMRIALPCFNIGKFNFISRIINLWPIYLKTRNWIQDKIYNALELIFKSNSESTGFIGRGQ